MTRKGTLIWDILQNARKSHRHLTADEIYQLAKKQDARIALATVYNNLNALEAEKKVRRVRQSSGPDYFDGNAAAHGHLVCDRCGEISDAVLTDFTEDLEGRLGTHITGYELSIRYVCPKCRQAQGV